MGCLLVLLAMISARLALIVLWIFTNLVDRAFDSFWVPLLGLLVLPWTTLMYVLSWSPVHGVTGIGWFFVILGFLFDLGSLARGRVEQNRRQATV
jgi:hypothetical protein